MMISRYQIPTLQAPPPLPEDQRPEASHPDAWWRQTNEPVREPPISFAALYAPFLFPDFARLLDPEFPSPDKWLAKYPDQHLVPQYPVNEGTFLPDYARLLDAETTTIDRWAGYFPGPVFTIPVIEGDSILPLQALAEDITLDKWYRQSDEPIRRKRGARAY